MPTGKRRRSVGGGGTLACDAMTKEEARSLVGRAMLYSSGFGEPEKVLITEATRSPRRSPGLTVSSA